jgi:uncharacterized protein YbjT (DUF2867 family)
MFAIIGATGKVGGAVARTLLTAHQSVRVVVRDASKGRVWSARGAAVVVADSGDAAALATALADVEGVFVMLPSTFDPTPGFAEARTVIAALHTALLQARPARVVVLSTIGADASQPNLLNQLGLLEQAFAELPMPVTFLRAAWFMENVSWDVASARTDGVIASYLQPLDKAFPMIATEDVGRTAAELLMESWSGHRIVELEGPSRVSPDDIAAAFARALGSPVKARVVARDSWDALFRAQGMKNPAPRMQMLDGFNAGWIDFTNRGAHSNKGTISIDQVIAVLVEKSRLPTETAA